MKIYFENPEVLETVRILHIHCPSCWFAFLSAWSVKIKNFSFIFSALQCLGHTCSQA